MDMIKVEHDVDVLGKGSSIDMKNVQSAWVVPLKEEEPVVTYVVSWYLCLCVSLHECVCVYLKFQVTYSVT
jgi:hypothetical protein